MLIDDIGKNLEQRFHERITNVSSLENIPLHEAVLLGATMICSALRKGADAIDNLATTISNGNMQPFAADKPSDAALHAALSGAGGPNPLVEVRAIPPDAVPIASVVQAPPNR
jgi:hypothetical protein